MLSNGTNSQRTQLRELSSKNKPRFNGVYLRNYLPKIKNGEYLISLNEYKSLRTHWIGLYVNGNNMTHVDS